jgi:gamma-glutamyltranspeptidase/glutathione hydrolase
MVSSEALKITLGNRRGEAESRNQDVVPKGENTTHFVVVDQLGLWVSATLSVNTTFGTGYIVPGTGVFLNNEMDDFSAQVGQPNAYGLVGQAANGVAAYKRPLSSMSPTMLEYSCMNAEGQTEQHRALIGTPGGSRIISMVILGIEEALACRPPEVWVSRARFHHQYLPDVIQYEKNAFSKDTEAELEALGYELSERSSTYGDMHVLDWNLSTGEIKAASDPRGEGEAALSKSEVTERLEVKE